MLSKIIGPIFAFVFIIIETYDWLIGLLRQARHGVFVLGDMFLRRNFNHRTMEYSEKNNSFFPSWTACECGKVFYIADCPGFNPKEWELTGKADEVNFPCPTKKGVPRGEDYEW